MPAVAVGAKIRFATNARRLTMHRIVQDRPKIPKPPEILVVTGGQSAEQARLFRK